MRKLSRLVLGVMAGLLLAQPGWTASGVLRVCLDDRPWKPYTNPAPGKPGSMQLLVSMAATDLGMTVDVVALPWKRCQELVRAGRLDALMGAGFVPLNRELAEFPLQGEGADARRSLGAARVVLVRRIGGRVDWDGKKQIDCTKPVGVPFGTQIIIDEVQKRGCFVDTGGKTDDQNIQKLLQMRVDLVAGYENDIRELVDSKYKGLVTVLPIPLFETHYYLAFSKQFYAGNQRLVDAFWTKIAEIKISAEYVRRVAP